MCSINFLQINFTDELIETCMLVYICVLHICILYTHIMKGIHYPYNELGKIQVNKDLKFSLEILPS